MGVAAILVMWPWPFEQTFVPASQGVSIWNLSLIGPVVSEKMFENVDGRTTDGRWTDGRRSHWYTISSPMSLRLRWAKNTKGEQDRATAGNKKWKTKGGTRQGRSWKKEEKY